VRGSKEQDMDSWDWIALAAFVMLVAILSLLVMHYLQLGKMGQVLDQWDFDPQRPKTCVLDQAELRSALRAEKAHVQQLLRKVAILQAMLPAA
jgi:hypothetical protein